MGSGASSAFAGSTIGDGSMQATGMVDDHTSDGFRRRGSA